MQQADVWAAGAFALEQGQIITAMLLAAMVVYAIEQRFKAACLTALVAAACFWFGLINAWQFSASDTNLQLGWGTGAAWAQGYLAMAVVLAAASWRGRITKRLMISSRAPQGGRHRIGLPAVPARQEKVSAQVGFSGGRSQRDHLPRLRRLGEDRPQGAGRLVKEASTGMAAPSRRGRRECPRPLGASEGAIHAAGLGDHQPPQTSPGVLGQGDREVILPQGLVDIPL